MKKVMNKKITTHLFTILTTFCILMGHSASPVFANGGYRTIGLPTPNSIPVAVVHSVAQRAGTNIVDIDFEITDQDDETATVGILAAIDGDFDDPAKWIIPKSLVEGTEDKIGKPISTNQTHRTSWYVKSDYTELSANFKIGLFAQDARRNKPVDLHFLELPVKEGNLVISRSPITTKEIIFYFRYLLSIQDPRVKLGRADYDHTSPHTGGNQDVPAIMDSDGTPLAVVAWEMFRPGGMQSGDVQLETAAGREFFINEFGSGYRWASDSEVTLAKEAATSGQINYFQPAKRVGGFPAAVNEYGFDPSWIMTDASSFGGYDDPLQFIKKSWNEQSYGAGAGMYYANVFWVVKEG